MQEYIAMRQEFVSALSSRYDEGEAGAMFRHLQRDTGSPEALKTELGRLLPALLSGRPFQYVTGKAWFYGMPLSVNESVLIPRPETEELVDRIIKSWDGQGTAALRIIDIGTGSGCIALALKKSIPEAEIYAVDISREALEVARKNAVALGLDIKFIQADILEWELVFDQDLRFDIVVSNPPYITPGEKTEMADHVLHYEPDLALFVPEESPLLFYQHIADFARQHLYPDGKLFFEINRSYGQEIKELLTKKQFRNIRLLQDMQGADRMIEAEAGDRDGTG